MAGFPGVPSFSVIENGGIPMVYYMRNATLKIGSSGISVVFFK
jgi:hypothetical protein